MNLLYYTDLVFKFPFYFCRENPELNADSLVLFIVIEHIFIVVRYFINILINDAPYWVRKFLRDELYLRDRNRVKQKKKNFNKANNQIQNSIFQYFTHEKMQNKKKNKNETEDSQSSYAQTVNRNSD